MQYKKSLKRNKSKSWYRNGEFSICSEIFDKYFDLIYPGKLFDLIISDTAPIHNEYYEYNINIYDDIIFTDIRSKDNIHYVLTEFSFFLRKIKSPIRYIWVEQ